MRGFCRLICITQSFSSAIACTSDGEGEGDGGTTTSTTVATFVFEGEYDLGNTHYRMRGPNADVVTLEGDETSLDTSYVTVVGTSVGPSTTC